MSIANSIIADNVAAVRAHMREAARRAGRSPDDVTLVAASKAQSPDAIRAAYAVGVRDFGENYAAELRDKRDALVDLIDIRWHFIGRVQRGNAKEIARTALVHGVGSISQAQALAKEAAKEAAKGHTLPVLLQVNVADEESKNGFAAHELAAAVAAVAAMPSLSPRGLMAMPAVDDEHLDAAFAAVRALREQYAPSWPLLSMGMSGDFERAIAYGATHVRVGTRLFGQRGYP